MPAPRRELSFAETASFARNKIMLGEFKVGRCSRQCFHEKRPLREGEWYYSVVIAEGENYGRREYSLDAWDGPPEGTIGHWKCRMPIAGEKKMILAPREVLIDLLRQMESFPDRAKTRYLLALILLRRRFVKLAESTNSALGGALEDTDETAETSQRVLRLQVTDDGSLIDVVECDIARSETESLSESLNELLYCEASEIEQEQDAG